VFCVCGCLFASAPTAWAKTINVNALAHIAVTSSSGGVLQLAGPLSDPAVANGGLLVIEHPAAGGYAGKATFVTPSGSVTAAMRVSARIQGPLAHLRVTAFVTAATGVFAGARGTLTGSATVTAVFGVGYLRLQERCAGPPGGRLRR